MATTTFLSNERLWDRISAQIKAARRVDATIAYVGQGGAKLLPLRTNDRLVVDMSLATVKAGSTDPREIEKLMRRGVKVFTRRNLHAKLIIADTSVIAGSANVSRRSKDVLDEAAIWTNDTAVVRRARIFVDRLCTEPIRTEYLETCKQHYRPPHLHADQDSKQRRRRVTHAKLWIVNLRDFLIPNAELERYERGEARAFKLISDESRSTTDSFHWPYKPKMAGELEIGDWLIQVLTYKDKSILVYPPARFLCTDNYARDAHPGKERWVFHLEIPIRGEAMRWKQFRSAARSGRGPQLPLRPRTQAIRGLTDADALLALWTPSGRVST